MKRAVIIDYGAGNLRSAEKAFQLHAGELQVSISVSADPKEVEAADHIVLPGVGAFHDCMEGLRSVPGMIEALEKKVLRQQTPFLGICVGMQLLASRGLEHGITDGLGWIPGEVRRLEPGEAACKIPHMGWNELEVTRGHPVLRDIRSGDHAYFVHSYGFVPADAGDVLATVTYGMQIIPAVIGRGNILATQFHPEKSQETGLQLIRHFLSWGGSHA